MQPPVIPKIALDYLDNAHKLDELKTPFKAAWIIKGLNLIIVKKHYLRNFQEPFFERLKEISWKLYDDGHDVTRTLDYRLRESETSEDAVYLLQELAPGYQLKEFIFDLSNPLRKQFAEEPLSLYEKYISDHMAIDGAFGDVDDNFTNLFYSSGKITFIDIEPQRIRPHKRSPKYAADNFNRELYRDDPIENQILEKMRQAALNLGKIRVFFSKLKKKQQTLYASAVIPRSIET